MAVTSSPSDHMDELLSAPEEETMKKKEKTTKKKNRSKCPGVRVVGGRIYDSQNGKTCHQCRQKTMDFVALCKTHKGNKQCPIGFCHKCLLNRYGEQAEQVALLDVWECPKCRGICNCSLCMKKRGHRPTGMLVHTAKEHGFSSVLELLKIKGSESFGHNKIENGLGVLPKKQAMLKESTVESPRKPGKENSFDGNNDLNFHYQNSTAVSKEKKSKKKERAKLKDVSNGKEGDDISFGNGAQKIPRITDESSNKEVKKSRKVDILLGKKISKKESKEAFEKIAEGNGKGEILVGKKKSKKESEEVFEKRVEGNGKGEVLVRKRKSKTQSREISKKEAGVKYFEGVNDDKDALGSLGVSIGANCKNEVSNGDKKDNLETNITKYTAPLKICTGRVQDESIDLHIQLPPGTCLITVAGIDLPPEVVGHVLQFMEFCSAFGKALNLKKGQAEAVIKEIINGRRGRRSQYSLVAQMQIDLLSLIQKDRGEMSPDLSTASGRNSWLQALEKCVSDCQLMLKEFSSACFGRGHEGYDELNTSEKLKLLNFLCDEALNTKYLRSWIENQHIKLKESTREAKEKVFALRDKEKRLKQKMLDEVAKAIIAKNGTPLSVSEHETIVSEIKTEAAKAHAELLEVMGILPRKRQRFDAVRTDPILLDVNGRAFWKLNVYNGRQDIILQETGSWNSVPPYEKWFSYDADQREDLEKYISSLRTKRLRVQKVAETPSVGFVGSN